MAADNDVPMPIQFVRRLKITREQEKNKKKQKLWREEKRKELLFFYRSFIGSPRMFAAR